MSLLCAKSWNEMPGSLALYRESTVESRSHHVFPTVHEIGSIMKKNNWLVIAWAPYSRRSEMFAKELGARLYCIHYLRFQAPPYAPVKYILQAVRTLQVLFTERPQAIHVQNPPFICTLVVYLYCRVIGAQFVIDHHSAAFARMWDWALSVQKFLARRAVTNIVTNQHWADIVHSWNAHALIMGDPFLALPRGQEFSVKPGFSVAFISTFASDEPLDAVLEAAAQLPQVHFYITGDTKRKPKSFFDNLPANVTFTDFLPDSQYIGLLRAIDVIMVLTTRDHTLQLGGCEAVSVGKPLITSDWPFLRNFFSKGTVYVTNTGDGIRDGILVMQKQHKELEREMMAFRRDNRHEWDTRLAQLKQMIGNHMSTSTPSEDVRAR
jgi:glycosyltransferase involved in cell wall biosynthesis